MKGGEKSAFRFAEVFLIAGMELLRGSFDHLYTLCGVMLDGGSWFGIFLSGLVGTLIYASFHIMYSYMN